MQRMLNWRMDAKHVNVWMHLLSDQSSGSDNGKSGNVGTTNLV